MEKIKKYNDISTLFLDVGNTLMSIDYKWVCDKLATLGVQCPHDTLQRAEAAARPVLSSRINEVKKNPLNDPYIFYITNILEKLPSKIIRNIISFEQVSKRLAPMLFPEDNAMRLWSNILPGTYEALEIFQNIGLPMHVISNADGTVKEQLIQSNLRPFFGEVIDSAVVQVEKPDPRIFEIALEKANCESNEALYVGDIYDVDIVGAESVGMKAVLIDPYSDWEGVACDRVPDLLTLAYRIQNNRR